MKLHTSSSIRFNMRSAQYLSYMQAFMKRLQALKIDNVMLNEKNGRVGAGCKGGRKQYSRDGQKFAFATHQGC